MTPATPTPDAAPNADQLLANILTNIRDVINLSNTNDATRDIWRSIGNALVKARADHEAARAADAAEMARLREESDNHRAKLDELGEYLWPDQTGLPNIHRCPTVAVKQREKLLREALEKAETERDEARSQVAALRADAARQWQPIETAPKDGTYILGVNMQGNPKHRYPEIISWRWSTYGDDPEKKDWYGANNLHPYATHWMPLPEPPQS